MVSIYTDLALKLAFYFTSAISAIVCISSILFRTKHRLWPREKPYYYDIFSFCTLFNFIDFNIIKLDLKLCVRTFANFHYSSVDYEVQVVEIRSVEGVEQG